MDKFSVAKSLLQSFRASEDCKDSESLYFSPHCWADLVSGLICYVNENLLHVVVVHSNHELLHELELNAARDLSSRGYEVTRIYLIPHKGFATEWVESNCDLDKRHGVNYKIQTLSSFSNGTYYEPFSSFLVLDDQLLIKDQSVPDGTSHSQNQIVVSCSNSLINEHSSFIHCKSLDEQKSRIGLDLEEPLVLSADLLAGISSVLCNGNHVDGDSCSWYHGNWQYLRLLDMVSTPTWHDSFYVNKFEEKSKVNERNNILISGTADYSILAYVMKHVENIGSLHVVDLCPTPLFSCKWLARRAGKKIFTHELSIQEFCNQADKRFEIICCDAFLTRFSDNEALNILKLWKSLLVNDGVVITTVRIYDETVPGSWGSEDIFRFKERAVVRAKRWKSFVNLTEKKVGELATYYASKMLSSSKGNSNSIRKLFIDAGLHIEHFDVVSVQGELVPSKYARIVAGIK